jgi:hypothetical protein
MSIEDETIGDGDGIEPNTFEQAWFEDEGAVVIAFDGENCTDGKGLGDAGN